MRLSQRLRQIANPMANEVTKASDIVRAAQLLDDCERFIRADELRTPQWRAELLARLSGAR